MLLMSLILLHIVPISCLTVGIDLGTTYSCVGYFQKGEVTIVPNDQGNRITPSMVAFTDDERLIGDAAKNQAPMNPLRTIYDAKRMIGREFDDPILQDDIKNWPFKVISKDGKPAVQVNVKGSVKTFVPEEISSMILLKMKQTAEAYTGEKVDSAVITVPAYFNDVQRTATKNAGVIAGLNVLRIINEPTAAAIAYGLDRESNSKIETILVFDLGGGTFDVSLLKLDEGVFEVLATNGDTHLGGQDFDNRLVNHFIQLFEKKHNLNIKQDLRALGKLRREAEKAKRALSTQLTVRVEIEGFFQGYDFSETITRAKFEELNMDLFKKTMKPVTQVLEDALQDKSDVDELILVGGSTRIPKVVELLETFFRGKKANNKINPDEAVAYGAAVQAGILGNEKGAEDLLLLDVNPLSLGIMVKGGLMSVLIKRNTPIPTKVSQIFTNTENSQRTVNIEVYEGERTLVKDNNLLGKFDLSLAPMPKGKAQIEVTFSMDSNGILLVSAKDLKTKQSNSITINNDKNRLTDEEIEQMVADASKYEEADKKQMTRIQVRNSLEDYAYTMRDRALKGKFPKPMSSDTKQEVIDLADDAIRLLEANNDAPVSQIKEKLTELQILVEPYLVEEGEETEGEGEGRFRYGTKGLLCR